MKRIMIAAPCSGSGKTCLTVALLRNLKKRGIKVFSVKSGPDYIDPLFHRTISGVDAYNLDSFFSDGKTNVNLLKADSAGKDFAVMEGVMGLFDGIGGVMEEGSSYLLAKETKTPVILVINAKGVGKTLAAQIVGMKMYDDEGLIRGVILNRVSEKYYDTLKACMEQETGISVLGFLPERKDAKLSSRHLGLVTPDETVDLQRIVDTLSDEFERHVDLDSIIRIAEEAGELPATGEEGIYDASAGTEKRCVIAVSKDEAFQFLYEENLRVLRNSGAEIRFFSPLHDESIPNDADALILCGGYPELYVEKLCKNTSMKACIRKAFEDGMPVIAECGGFLYLHKQIGDLDGIFYEGVGIIDAECRYTPKSIRFGYIEIQEKNTNFLSPGDKIKGHEFHYYESSSNGNDCRAVKPFDGTVYECIHNRENSWIGFPHLYYPSNPDFAKAVIEKAVAYHNGRER